MSASALQAAAKVHKTAVCLVPPRSAWPRLQEVRLFNDKSFARWPPHVNLLYPFLEEACFDDAAQLCSEALRPLAAFDVSLERLGVFEHGRSCTLWLNPDAPELLQVQAALARAFPQCTDLSSDPARGIQRFTPHLSLGQWRDRAAAEAVAAALAPAWRQAPLRFRAGGVALISRGGFQDPFHLRWFVPLGGGAPVALGSSGVPYLATVGECSLHGSGGGGGDPAAELAAELAGLGAARADGTAWVFSFGANMSPRKLQARGVRPLQSLPARLPGWRLAFTHRGGMGTLEAAAAGEEGAAAHGVLHRVSAADYVGLANAEHEYRPVEVAAEPYGGGPPLPAVAFVTPEERRIVGGLPPPSRYLQLLQEGAAHWGLEEGYARQLADMPSVDSAQRGPEYYSTPDGQPLEALPKIRTGSQPRRQRGRQHGRQPQPQQARV